VRQHKILHNILIFNAITDSRIRFEIIFVDILNFPSSFLAMRERTRELAIPPARRERPSGSPAFAGAVALGRAACSGVSSVRETLPDPVKRRVGRSSANRFEAIDGVESIAALDDIERRFVLLGYESAESS